MNEISVKFVCLAGCIPFTPGIEHTNWRYFGTPASEIMHRTEQRTKMQPVLS
ncbi:MAG: hypothetical protein GY758_21885 [Fuerstiella sp.]|nr:hypothetical protein [Fuerstiella sp.]MCP4509203.1 hypothetical protein [Fuerstiella sp.]MCP4785859.1 hypothetical protein [Fuerstiella sp.]MCP4855720.1 hypothetical protein [Fuerstiella sp.]